MAKGFAHDVQQVRMGAAQSVDEWKGRGAILANVLRSVVIYPCCTVAMRTASSGTSADEIAARATALAGVVDPFGISAGAGAIGATSIIGAMGAISTGAVNIGASGAETIGAGYPGGTGAVSPGAACFRTSGATGAAGGGGEAEVIPVGGACLRQSLNGGYIRSCLHMSYLYPIISL